MLADARWVVREAARADSTLRRHVKVGARLPSLGYGASAVVLGLGHKKVIKVITGAYDRKVAHRLADYRGPGWPKIYGVWDLDIDESSLWAWKCVAVVERARRPGTLNQAVHDDLLQALFTVDDAVDAPPARRDAVLSVGGRVEAYARQLWTGLVAIGRTRQGTDVDDSIANVGLTDMGQAVWLDFGV